MTTNQEGLQDAIRSYTSTTGTIVEDWHALFDGDSIADGTYNERILAWINAVLGETYTNVAEAQQAFAADQGFDRWSSMNTFVTGARITLDSLSIAEDQTQGTLVGNLAVVNGSGSYTFTLTDTSSNAFQLDAGDSSLLEVGSAGLDYETATSHTITVEADNGVDTPISRNFTIVVIDVVEGGVGDQWDFQFAGNSGHILTSGMA